VKFVLERTCGTLTGYEISKLKTTKNRYIKYFSEQWK